MKIRGFFRKYNAHTLAGKDTIEHGLRLLAEFVPQDDHVDELHVLQILRGIFTTVDPSTNTVWVVTHAEKDGSVPKKEAVLAFIDAHPDQNVVLLTCHMKQAFEANPDLRLYFVDNSIEGVTYNRYVPEDNSIAFSCDK